MNNNFEITGTITAASSQLILEKEGQVYAKYTERDQERAKERARTLGCNMKKVASGVLLGATQYKVGGKALELPESLQTITNDGEVYNPSINLPENLAVGSKFKLSIAPENLSFNENSKTFSAKAGSYEIEQISGGKTLADFC